MTILFPKRLLLPAIGLLLAVVAACGGSSPTATSSPPPVVVRPSPTPIATATPEPSTPTRLLELLATMPASLKGDGIWFGDSARTLDLAQIEKVNTLDELLVLGAEAMPYLEAVGKIAQPARSLVRGYGNLEWEQVFGFGPFAADSGIGTGETTQSSPTLTYFEGTLDGQDIAAKLVELGYSRETHKGVEYYSILGDFEADPQALPGTIAGSSMNRVALLTGALLAAPSTEMLTGVLDAISDDAETLAEDPAFFSLARSLGDPLSAVLMTKEGALLRRGQPPRNLFEFPRPDDWQPLHDWEAVAFGLREEAGRRSLRMSLFYPEPLDANADGEEITQRMGDYRSTVLQPDSGRRIFAESCADLSWAHRPDDAGSVLIITCLLVDQPPVLWHFLVDNKDLAFLLA